MKFLLGFLQEFLLGFLQEFLPVFLNEFLPGFLQEIFLAFLQEFLSGFFQEFLPGFSRNFSRDSSRSCSRDSPRNFFQDSSRNSSRDSSRNFSPGVPPGYGKETLKFTFHFIRFFMKIYFVSQRTDIQAYRKLSRKLCKDSIFLALTTLASPMRQVATISGEYAYLHKFYIHHRQQRGNIGIAAPPRCCHLCCHFK